jgi:hypothetical protein
MRLKTKIRAGKIRPNHFNVLRERMEGETDRLNGITTQ